MGLEVLPSAVPHPRTLLEIHARHLGECLREPIRIVGRHHHPCLGAAETTSAAVPVLAITIGFPAAR